MKKLFFPSIAVPFLIGCSTIDLSRTAQDDLYWRPSDEPVYAAQYEEAPSQPESDDYWDGSNGTTANTQSGDVVVNNYYDNQSAGWAGWDPYWGWGFGVGWYGPRHYRRWYTMGLWNSWYSPMWYHDPWFWDPYWGYTYHPYYNPWGNPWAYQGVGWGNGWSQPGPWLGDGGGSGGNGVVVGSFNPISTNSSGNSSYNGQGQHVERKPRSESSPAGGGVPFAQFESRNLLPSNYVERFPVSTNRPSSEPFEVNTNGSSVSRGLLNIPTSSASPMKNPEPKPASPKPSSFGTSAPDKKPARQQNWNVPQGNPLPASTPSHSTSPSRSSGSSGSAPARQGGSGGGGGRPPRN
jgi:hypothetical protein